MHFDTDVISSHGEDFSNTLSGAGDMWLLGDYYSQDFMQYSGGP